MARRVAQDVKELVESEAAAVQHDVAADVDALKAPVALFAGAAFLGLSAAELVLVSLFVERKRARFVVGGMAALGAAVALGVRGWMMRPRRLRTAERATRIADDVREAARAF